MTDDQPDDFTIPQFCSRNRICKASYYNLRRRGQGPREKRVLIKVTITREAEADWREARQTPDQTDLDTIERLRARTRKAVRTRAINTASDNSPEAA